MASLLYSKYAADESNRFECDEVFCFSPTPFHLFHKSEEVSVKSFLVRLYFCFIAHGKMKIYCYMADKKTAHTSVVMPKCFKFPYMEKSNYTIGPCFTKKEYRGQGIYPKVLSCILSAKEYSGSKFYMVVSDTNSASVRGIEKAGFQRCGTIRKSKILKRYYREEITHDT